MPLACNWDASDMHLTYIRHASDTGALPLPAYKAVLSDARSLCGHHPGVRVRVMVRVRVLWG